MVDCANCIEKCPQAAAANDIAKGRMYATQEFIRVQKELERYQKAEAEGRLLVLPCKVGDAVYQKDHCGNIYEAIVQSVVIDKRRTIFITSGIGFDETAVGKTVFLTREEAEAKLKEGTSDGVSD